MSNLISRQAVIEIIDNHIFYDDYDSMDKISLINAIRALPSAERHGRWIREPNCWYRCSVCGEHYPSIADNMKYNYCPNCGAKME